MMKGRLILALLLWMAVANNIWGENFTAKFGHAIVSHETGDGYVYASTEDVDINTINDIYWKDESYAWDFGWVKTAEFDNYKPYGSTYWIYAKPAFGNRFVGWYSKYNDKDELISTDAKHQMTYGTDINTQVVYAWFERHLDYYTLSGIPAGVRVYAGGEQISSNNGNYAIIETNKVTLEWDGNGVYVLNSATTYTEGDHYIEFNMPSNDFAPLQDFYWLYNVAFDSHGHGTAPATQKVKSTEKPTQPADLSEKGYIFGGWYADEECNSPFDFTAALSGDVTVHAKWTARENTITFNTDNKGVTPDEQKLITGGIIEEPAIQYVGNEYIEGWYTDAAYKNQYFFGTPVDGDLTLYAKWVLIGRTTIITTGGNSDCIVTLKDANDQPANEQLIPGVYTLTVTPANGYSFNGNYTFTERSTGASIMPVTISGTTTQTYTLDLTNKDVNIYVTFSTSPIVTISETDDGNDLVYDYTLKDGTNATFANGSTLTHIFDESDLGATWSNSHDLTLTITPGVNIGCKGTITNNGVVTAITANKTSYTFTPKGNIVITLYFYDKTNPAKYAITTDDMCAVYNADYWSEKTPLTKAPEDMELMIELIGGVQPPSGKYFTGEYTVNGVSLGRESEWSYINTFTMPAEAVKVVALQADKTVLKFDFSAAGPQEVPKGGIILFNGDVRVSWTPVDNNYQDYLVDFDGGGTPDMKWWYDASGHCYVEQLATADARGNFTFNYDDPTSCYSAITFYFPTVTKIGGTTITTTMSGYLVDVDDETQTGGVIDLTDGTGVGLTSRRTLSAPSGGGDLTIEGQTAKLYTVCLPVDPKTSANVKYYELSGANAEGTGLLFDEVATPVKNTPYLVAVFSGADLDLSICTATSTNVEQTVTNTSGGNGYTLKGTLKGLTNAEAVGKLILQSGARWGKVTSEKTAAYIPPMRGYVEGPASAARLMVSFFDNDNATGIEHIRTMDADGTERWYDLNGRQIDKPTKKGIYIHNGKKTTN